jgi:hypothetical protein
MQRQIVKGGIYRLAMIGVFFCLAVFVAPGAQADDLAGSSDPALQAAIATWLQDNDEDSLPVFATLAAAGNIAARLLLARIEVTDQAPGDYLMGLSRKERVALFRSSSGKGIFRPTWLKAEAEAGNQTAALLLDSANTVVNLDAIRALYGKGEPEAAYDLIREVAGNGSPEQKQELATILQQNAELLPYLRALQDPQAGLGPGHTALQWILGSDALQGPESDTRAAAYFVEYGYQTGVQTSDFDRANYYYAGLASWIESAPATAPIARLCRRYCGEDPANCAITVFGLAGGYYKAIKFDSPMEELIDQSRYLASDRALGMMLRRVAFARPAGASGTLLISDAELRSSNACLSTPVAALRAQRN